MKLSVDSDPFNSSFRYITSKAYLETKKVIDKASADIWSIGAITYFLFKKECLPKKIDVIDIIDTLEGIDISEEA